MVSLPFEEMVVSYFNASKVDTDLDRLVVTLNDDSVVSFRLKGQAQASGSPFTLVVDWDQSSQSVLEKMAVAVANHLWRTDPDIVAQFIAPTVQILYEPTQRPLLVGGTLRVEVPYGIYSLEYVFGSDVRSIEPITIHPG
ncbi:hypothetical protein [Herbiconiux liangxiaofengii]|uniref:hypothetical protein n=1 Tax=Herbiconiux liangxiaofengii TaxID=3342795 RepID=UPI0035BA58B6